MHACIHTGQKGRQERGEQPRVSMVNSAKFYIGVKWHELCGEVTGGEGLMGKSNNTSLGEQLDFD